MVFCGAVIGDMYHTWYSPRYLYVRQSLRLCLMTHLNRVDAVSEEARDETHEHAPRTTQVGSPVTDLPLSPTRTSSARKSVNGPMSWRTLAYSRPAL